MKILSPIIPGANFQDIGSLVTLNRTAYYKSSRALMYEMFTTTHKAYTNNHNITGDKDWNDIRSSIDYFTVYKLHKEYYNVPHSN